MNALIPPTASQRRGVQKALAISEAKYLEPLEPPWSSESFSSILHRGAPLLRVKASPEAVERAKEVVNVTFSTSADLIAYRDALVQASTLGTSDEIASRAMIGMLLDAFPHSRPPNLDAYAGSMLHDVASMGFNPAVVAAACRELRRTLKFPPAISEMVAACEAERERYERLSRLAATQAEILGRAEQLIAGAEE
jgi:hypothetical protein